MFYFKSTLFLLVSLFTTTFAFGQYESVIFDYQNAYFNNGQPVQAESNLMFTGPISKKIERVEVSVFKAKGNTKKPIYSNAWKRSYGNSQELFNLPFNYKLKGDASYDFAVDYFRELSKEEKAELKQSVYEAVDNYLSQSFSINGRKVTMLNSVDAVMSDINSIVRESFYYYRNESEVVFPGFSDIVKKGLKSLVGRKLSNQEAANLGDNTDHSGRVALRASLFDKRMDELKNVAHNEIDQVINTRLLIRSDNRMVLDYPTEHTRNDIAINVGYGATYFNGDLKNLDYGRGTYLGLSFPLGNSALGGRFWSNSSISAGAFLNNFKDKNDNTVTGPIFGRPYYVAYGYRMFRFLRLNAGATFLQTDASNNGVGNINTNTLQIRPFIGLSAELRFWLGLGDSKR